MKFTYSEISTLQIGKVYGPFAVTRDQLYTARASITNYKGLWPGAAFKTKSSPMKFTQPDGEEIELKGWFEFYVERISYGTNVQSGKKEALACSSAKAEASFLCT